MKIDDLEPKDLYGDLNTTIKQSIDLVKEDSSFRRVPSGAVRGKTKGPHLLQSIKGLAAVVLVLFLADFLIGGGWNLLVDASSLLSLIVALVALVVLVGIAFIQYVLSRNQST